jgi:subtilisin family serine protease
MVIIGALVLADCKEGTAPTPGTPTTLALVSGSNQTGDVSAALVEPLVVRALDGAGRPVAGVAISWTVTGGGSASPPTSSTDAQGRDSATWTLGATPGAQAATATSSAIPGAAVSFTASNGPTITGAVSVADPDPTIFFASPPAQGSTVSSAGRAAVRTRYSSRGITVTFRSGVVRVAAAGSPTYRSLEVARSAAAALRQRATGIVRGLPMGVVRVSPAILAAHITLTDTSNVDSVLAVLRADPSVASASRDVIYTVRDGSPTARPAGPRAAFMGTQRSSGVATRLPDDPYYAVQSWGANMTDLPRAWAITTGSGSSSIAVVDMGVRFDDPALAANLTSDGYDFVSQTALSDLGHSSPGQICGGGTFTDIAGDGDGPDSDPTDPDDVSFDSTNNCWQPSSLGDHGEWVSGIIGAVGNDGATMAGIDWTARIRPVRALGITGEGDAFDIAQGILYAAGLPASGAGDTLVTAPSRSAIINLSLVGFGDDPTERAAVAAAVQAGCLVVAAAGNASTSAPSYPAAYPDVVGVSAVGMDGTLASYSDMGSYVDLAAPGGEVRGDDNGGGGVLGPGWDFTSGQPVFLFGYGTSAAAPYVSGIAGLLLAANPGLSGTELAQRLEQYASRAPNSTRNDSYGWGIVNAYDALTEQDGPPRASYVRLLSVGKGRVVRTVAADATGQFALTQLDAGAYELQAGEDESGDGLIGLPGRRFSWAGSGAAPTTFTMGSEQPLVQTTAIALGVPTESEPNDTRGTADPLSVDSYVVGQIAAPDVTDEYRVVIPASGSYTFETSGVLGACGWGIELDTRLDLLESDGTALASNDNSGLATGPQCSRITAALAPGTYYVVVSGSTANGLASQGRYRLQIRTGS